MSGLLAMAKLIRYRKPCRQDGRTRQGAGTVAQGIHVPASYRDSEEPGTELVLTVVCKTKEAELPMVNIKYRPAP